MAKITKSPREQLTVKKLKAKKAPSLLDHAWYEQGTVKAGIWRSCGYTEFYESYPCDEFMVVLEGEVTVENESFSATYKAGDSFLIPKGFRGFWRQPGDMLKYYMIVS